MMETVQAVSPAILLIAWASLMYVAASFVTGSVRGWLSASVLGLALAGAAEAFCAGQASPGNVLVFGDPLARFGSVLALATGLGLVLMSTRLAERETTGEYFASLLLVVAGGILVARARELILLFLALETISIPTYVLLCLARQDQDGKEATAKYFFLSIFSSALFLYGLSFLYGTVGTTHLALMAQPLSMAASSPTMLLALTLIMAGLGFKIAAVPFHFYAPDVYQGTSTAAAAVLAWAPKAAGVFALLRLLVFTLSAVDTRTLWLLWVLAAVTMTVGNVLGLLQDNLRRLLAYSGIAHAGYLLLGIGAACAGAGPFLTSGPVDAVMFYLVVYAAMTLGVFATLVYLHHPDRPVETIDDLAGLARTHPLLAAGLAAMLIGLTGIPLTAGFWGKLAIFASAVTCREPSFLWLAVIGVLNAAISAYYYLRIVAAMYMGTSEQPVRPAGGSGPLTVAVAGMLITLVVGILPASALRLLPRGDAPAAVAVEGRVGRADHPRGSQPVPGLRFSNGSTLR